MADNVTDSIRARLCELIVPSMPRNVDPLHRDFYNGFNQCRAEVLANLESLKPEPHCESCTCFVGVEYSKPEGWSIEEIEVFLAIDPATITYMQGGW